MGPEVLANVPVARGSELGFDGALMRVVPDSPLTVGYRIWQLRPPQPSLTVVVKGTFDLVVDGPATFAEEPVEPTGELWVDDDVEKPLATPSDFALLKPRGEVMVIGNAWAPEGRPAAAVMCSSASAPREALRRVRRPDVARRGAGEPHVRAHSVRVDAVDDGQSVRGPGYAPNPYGRGRKPEQLEDGSHAMRLPNVEDPNRPRRRSGRDAAARGGRPAAAHVARPDAVRRHLRRRVSARALAVLPQGLHWAFFQEAPKDQRLKDGYFNGDESIELVGLHPVRGTVRSALPAVVPRVLLTKTEGSGEPKDDEVALRLDTVVWDGAIGKLLLTWRGVVEIPSETLEGLGALYVTHEPLRGPHKRPARLRERLDAILAAEEEEETTAEGEPPPRFDDDEEDTLFELEPVGLKAAVDETTGPEDEARAEAERELADKQAKMRAVWAEAGIDLGDADAPAAPPPTTEALRAKLDAAGDAVPADLRASLERQLEELEADPTPTAGEEPPLPEAPAEPEGRALVEARLAEGLDLRGLDLSGVDLRGLDLSGQDLSGSLLREAKLARVSLRRAKLVGATLAQADLSECDLGEADLTDAELHQARLIRANLEATVLEDAHLEEAALMSARLVGARAARALFTGSNLQEAQLSAGDFEGADFEAANLKDVDASEAVFRDATLEGADASGARFDRAVMTQARAEGIRAEGARFGGIDAHDSFWEGAQLARCDFSLAKLDRADFSGAVLTGTEMDGCTLREARFDHALAQNLVARKTDFMEASFESADLRFADLRGASLFGAELYRAQTGDARLDHADLTRTKLEA